MDETLVKQFLMCVSVVLLAMLVGTISWTIVLGTSIRDDFLSEMTTYYSEAGLSIMIDSYNLDSIDSANLYKVMEVNSNVIVDYRIVDLEGNLITDLKELLSRPTDRWSIVIEGDSSIGFKLEAMEVEVVE